MKKSSFFIALAFSMLVLNSCEEDEVSGCTDPNSSNFDPNATTDDGSCVYANTAEYSIELNGDDLFDEKMEDCEGSNTVEVKVSISGGGYSEENTQYYNPINGLVTFHDFHIHESNTYDIKIYLNGSLKKSASDFITSTQIDDNAIPDKKIELKRDDATCDYYIADYTVDVIGSDAFEEDMENCVGNNNVAVTVEVDGPDYFDSNTMYYNPIGDDLHTIHEFAITGKGGESYNVSVYLNGEFKKEITDYITTLQIGHDTIPDKEVKLSSQHSLCN